MRLYFFDNCVMVTGGLWLEGCWEQRYLALLDLDGFLGLGSVWKGDGGHAGVRWGVSGGRPRMAERRAAGGAAGVGRGREGVGGGRGMVGTSGEKGGLSDAVLR